MRYVVFDPATRTILRSGHHDYVCRASIGCAEGEDVISIPDDHHDIDDTIHRMNVTLDGVEPHTDYREDATVTWQRLRMDRDRYLASSDFTQLPDYPVSDDVRLAWRDYRQKLRDLPANTPDPSNPFWPTAPNRKEKS